MGPDPFADETPRPIGVDPAVTGSFKRISAGEGAIVPTRDNASQAAGAALQTLSAPRGGARRLVGRNRPKVERRGQKLETNNKLFVIIGVVAAAVIVVMAIIFTRAYNSTGTKAQTSMLAATTQLGVGETISYGGYSYGLSQASDGTWQLSRTAEGSTGQAELASLAGTPVTLLFSKGVFYVPENLGGTWDVIAYTLGDGSVGVQLSDSSGNPVGGSGSIASASIVDSTAVLVDSTGATIKVALS